MTKTAKPPPAPKPKGWLARTFGFGGPDPEPIKAFDFNAMQRSLDTLGRKSESGE